MIGVQVHCDGRALRLGHRLGKGGEGEVYSLIEDVRFAVKIYTGKDARTRERKVRAMVDAALHRNAPHVTFPIAVACRKDGAFAGFLMSRVSGHKPIHELYSPGSRKKHFPQADYRFLVRVAANIARAVASVHRSGCVIGDINHSSILVSPRAVASLIDADSFQFSVGTVNYFCRVGVPEYTPPELQGLSLAGTLRTKNHDAFGLAIMVFQLLFMGRHPFAGTVRHGELPSLQENIRAFRYVYSVGTNVGLEVPPGTPAVGICAPGLVSLFERAFASALTRPTAEDWVSALDELEASLLVCSKDSRYSYPRQTSKCPWCEIEADLGNQLFVPMQRPTSPLNSDGGHRVAGRAAIVSPREGSQTSPIGVAGVLAAMLAGGAAVFLHYSPRLENPTPVAPLPASQSSVARPTPVSPGPELVGNRWLAPQQTGEDPLPYGFAQNGTTCMLVTAAGLISIQPRSLYQPNAPNARSIGQWVVWPLGFATLSTGNTSQSTDATRESVTYRSIAPVHLSIGVRYQQSDSALILDGPDAVRELSPGCGQEFNEGAIRFAFAWSTELGGEYLSGISSAIRRFATMAIEGKVNINDQSITDAGSWPTLSDLVGAEAANAVDSQPASTLPFSSISIEATAPSLSGPSAYVTKPRYPRMARLRGQEGSVTLVFEVLPSGALHNVQVLETSGVAALDKAAVREAQKQWKLAPGTKDGVATQMSAQAIVTFRQSDKSVDVQIN